VKRSLREILADSHIAAVAIGVLLLWSLSSAAWAFRIPLYRAAEFAVTAVAILGIPYSSHAWTGAEQLMLITVGYGLYGTLVSLAGAWLLSRWVYGVGPFQALVESRARLARRNHA